MSARTIGAIITTALLAGLAYLQLSTPRGAVAPSIPAVSSCKLPKPGMKRIGGELELDFRSRASIFQFDVPAGVAIPFQGWLPTDVPGVPSPVYAITLTHGSGESYLYISWGETEAIGIGRAPIPPVLAAPPGHFESHKVFDDNGKQIGEDFWGYRDNGEYWRRVHLAGFLSARYGSKNDTGIPSYGSVHEQDAAVLDQIPSVACLNEKATATPRI
jgi:hypothetical protein